MTPPRPRSRKAALAFIAVTIAVAATGLTARAEPWSLTLAGPSTYNLGAPVTGFAGILRAGLQDASVPVTGLVEVHVDGVLKTTVRAEPDGEYRFTLPAFSDNGPHTVQAWVFKGLPPFEAKSPQLSLVSAAKLTMTPTTHDFGTVIAATSPVDKVFTVTNVGASLSGTLGATVTGSEFSTSGCAGTKLAGGASCALTVRVTPRIAGTKLSTLTVTGMPGGTVKATMQVAVTGLSLSPVSVSFPDAPPGSTSQPRVITVTNTASVATGTISLSPGGADPSQFPISNDTCSGVSLSPQGQCNFTIRFTPASIGFKTATATLTATPGGSPVETMSGTGLSARLDILPVGTDFGSTVPGQSKDKTMKVVNSGLETSGPITISLAGPDASRFSVVANPCTTLVPNASCEITVRFSPDDRRNYTAHVSASAEPGGTFNAWLKGVGSVA